MGNGLKKTAVLNNMISQIVVQFVTLIAGLLVPRYIILYYGSEINGLATSVNQIINYAALLEAGLGTASIHALYKPIAKKDYDRVNSICSSTRKFFNKVGFYFVIAVLGVSAVYPFLAKGETDRLTISLLIITIASTNVFEYFFHAKYRVILTADQKLYVIGYSRAVGILLQTATKIVLILQGVHVLYVYLAASVVLLLRIVFIRMYVRKRYSWLNFSAEPDDGALGQRKALVLHQLSGLAVNNTSSIVISTCIPSGLSLASIYSVYNMVVSNIYILITGVFSNGVVATFGQAKALKGDDEFCKSYRRYEFGYYIVASVIYGTMAAMILPFVNLYTKSADINYISYSIAVLFIVVGILNATRVPGGMLINAAGHFSQTKNRALIEAIINIVFMLVLVWPFKIEGVLLASVFSFLYRTPDIILYTNKHILHSSPLLSIRRALRMWVCCALSVVLMHNILMPTNIDSWWTWILWSAISVCVTLLVSLLLNFVFERNSFVALAKSLFVWK